MVIEYQMDENSYTVQTRTFKLAITFGIKPIVSDYAKVVVLRPRKVPAEGRDCLKIVHRFMQLSR